MFEPFLTTSNLINLAVGAGRDDLAGVSRRAEGWPMTVQNVTLLLVSFLSLVAIIEMTIASERSDQP